LLLIFLFHAPATTEIYTLSLHDALPISILVVQPGQDVGIGDDRVAAQLQAAVAFGDGAPVVLHQIDEHPLARLGEERGDLLAERSEEHTSELQSRGHLVCRLLLEKKKIT